MVFTGVQKSDMEWVMQRVAPVSMAMEKELGSKRN
jgi:hypothetical protein